MRFVFVSVTLAALLVYAVGFVDSTPRSPAEPPPGPDPRWIPSPEPPGRPVAPGTAAAVARIASRGDVPVRVLVRLDEPALVTVPESAGAASRRSHADRLARAHDRALAALERVGARPLARLGNLVVGVVVEMPGRLAPEVAALPGVVALHPVHDYETHLSETIPYIGADSAHAMGVDGSGVKVAVLDSGVDYTHRAFGGPGTQSAYDDAYFGSDPGCVTGAEAVCANRATPDPALFGPTAPKIKGGFDYVGESWPGGALSGSSALAIEGGFDEFAAVPPLVGEEPDPDPIDYRGHGTHVTDALGGFGYAAGTDGDGNAYPDKGPGVAPGVDVWAFKVCSAISDACSGLALIQAMDAAMDLDGSPGTIDPADVIVLALGSAYGQPEDGLVYLVNLATQMGSVVVASAGADGDRPFIVASPSIADGAISVGAVQHPGQQGSTLHAGGLPFLVLRQLWSPAPNGLFFGSIDYGTDTGTQQGCLPDGSNPFAPGSLLGSIVLVDRGTCTFDVKAANAAAAGAVAAVLVDDRAQSANELPVAALYGGENVTIPAYSVTTGSGALLKQRVATSAFLDPVEDVPLIDTVQGGSSRGPRINDNSIKPDILGPGGGFSARVGTGGQTAFFGGTSMAAPHIAGSAALVIAEHPDFTPYQVKSVLMNTAETDVYVDFSGGYRAPITLAGAGLVDTAAALDAAAAGVLAYVETTPGDPVGNIGSASFGYRAFTNVDTYPIAVTVENNSQDVITGTLKAEFRDPSEAAHVPLSLGASLPVPAGGSATASLIALVTNAVHDWSLDKGAGGFDGRAFDLHEYDGWFIFDVDGTTADPRLPWQLLPKKTALVSGIHDPTPAPEVVGSVVLGNGASISGLSEVFRLLNESPDMGFTVGDCSSISQQQGCEMSPVDLKQVGVRERTADLDADGTSERWIEWALTVWDDPYRSAQWPAQFNVWVDVDQNGVDDYILFNAPTSNNDGRNAVYLNDIGSGMTQFAMFTDSDFNTQNWILGVPTALLGLNTGDPFDFYVVAREIYFGNTVWDCAPLPSGGNPCGSERYTYTVGMPRFGVDENDLTIDVPAGGSTTYTYTMTFSRSMISPDEYGFLLLNRRARVGQESQAIPIAIPGVDDDGDGATNSMDCDPADPTATALPAEVTQVLFTNSTQMVWTGATATSGAGTVYDVYREDNAFGAVGNDPNGAFLATGLSGEVFQVVEVPVQGGVMRVVVRARNSCGNGPWGFDSANNPWNLP